jgi:hypothetical protein
VVVGVLRLRVQVLLEVGQEVEVVQKPVVRVCVCVCVCVGVCVCVCFLRLER